MENPEGNSPEFDENQDYFYLSLFSESLKTKDEAQLLYLRDGILNTIASFTLQIELIDRELNGD